jgi:hypothetical protein
MRLARRLVPLAVTATAAAAAAIALATPSAFAQTEPLTHHAGLDITVSAEAGTSCPAVSINAARTVASGGCVVHGGGPNIVLLAHVFGVESIQFLCNWEFDLRIDADGEGFFTHQELTQGTQGICNRRPCGSLATGEGRPWGAHSRETGAVAPTEVLTLLFCIEGFDSGPPVTHQVDATHCEVSMPMIETANHRYSFGSTTTDANGHGTAGFRCELRGVFTTEATQVSPTGESGTRTQVEVNHL